LSKPCPLPVLSIDFNPASGLLASCGADKEIKVRARSVTRPLPSPRARRLPVDPPSQREDTIYSFQISISWPKFYSWMDVGDAWMSG
jgi:hypothetical protein